MKSQSTLITHPKNLDRLALAILHQARLDWQAQRHRGQDSLDLIVFFNSSWFDDLCYLVGRNPNDARRNLHIPRCPSRLVAALVASRLDAVIDSVEPSR